MKKIAENLKYIREEKNISVYDIEKDIKISHQNLYKWEKALSEPSIVNCIKLADYYDISLDELVGRNYGHYSTQSIQINHGNNNTQNNYFKK